MPVTPEGHLFRYDIELFEAGTLVGLCLVQPILAIVFDICAALRIHLASLRRLHHGGSGRAPGRGMVDQGVGAYIAGATEPTCPDRATP